MTLLAAAAPRALWYATRGTGVVSLVILTGVVALGVATSRRARTDRWPRFLVAGLHRNLTLLALVFLAAHIATTVLDGFAPIRWLDAVLPFASAYRPVWLGLGAVAFDLLLALTVTSLLRTRIGYRPWRALHWLAYAAWPVALVHALGTGSDARAGRLQALAAACVVVVAAAVLARLARTQWTPPRAGATALVLIVPLAVFAWYRDGPGRRGWAGRAGTPATLLRAAARPVPPNHRSAPPRPPQLHPAPFTAALVGRLQESSQDEHGLVVLDIRATTRRPAPGVLWVRLQGVPTEGGGVQMTASGASYGPPGAPEEYVGRIVGLEGTRILLALRHGSRRLSVRVDLRLDALPRISGVAVVRKGAA
jgi:sulfoxide reductase heme-binding subunit YedZ